MKKSGAIIVALFCCSTLAFAQAGQTPAGQKPAGQKPTPSTRRPATTKPAPAKPAAAAKPAPEPPPSDVRFKSRYTTGDQVTEGVTYLRRTRERYELGDMILLRRHDLKQTVQISRAANTYLVVPDPTGDAATAAADAQKASGVVNVETSVADIGERKPMFGREARRVMTVIDRQPQAGACDQTKQRIETDAWYIDAPKTLAAQPPSAPPSSAAACRDDIKATLVGDAALLGFPIAYTTTIPGPENKPVVVMQMEVTEFEVTNLDEALFEIPAGMRAAATGRELAKAVSDANEAKLASPSRISSLPRRSGDLSADARSAKVEAAKAGLIRVGVPELANKTTQNVDTRALRTQLIAELAEHKMEAVPLASASQDELNAYAKDLGCDYLVVAQITELKASKPGRIGRMIKATAGESPKDVTEAKLTFQLVPVGAAKAKFSTNTSGNDGGIGFKTGLRLARVAAMLYLRYASPIGALNAMQLMNMGGMGGFLNNPMLMQLQGGGAGMMGAGGGGIDRTAGAAMFMMEQAMAGAAGDGMQEGPSFDASLAEAMQDGAKKVVDLIVDDEPDTRDLLKQGLEFCGAKVEVAATADEAMDAIVTRVPDILISDIGMPNTDGYELIRKVRGLPVSRGGKVAAVALTAYTRIEDRLHALRAGYDMHVPKPVELAELVAVAASVVRRNG